MLSRIAESLFWIGRYIERAEETARILEVHLQHLLEAPSLDEARSCQVLLDCMGVQAPGGQPVDTRLATETLAFDGSVPSSIVASITAARSNARGVSEAISSEMWEAINATYNALPSQVSLGRRAGPYGFFRYVRERAAVVAGLTDSTMSRDDAWRFLVLGRSLERTDMLARLLATTISTTDRGDTGWVIVLRSCSAHEAFLRTYSREPDAASVVEFLLLDRLFPRSMYAALATAESCLAEIAPHAERAGTTNEPRRLLGLARAGLEYRRIDDLLADLSGHLGAVQRGCASATAAVAARYFRQTKPIFWMPEGTGLQPGLPTTVGEP